MAMLTKDQKTELAERLSLPFGSVSLLCDGHHVALVVERCKGFKYRVMTYVDGCFKGQWMLPKDGAEPAPETKFLRKSVRPNLSPTKRKVWEKAMGKRYVKSDPYCSGSVTIYMPDWSCGKSAINHLCKVCESVELPADPALSLMDLAKQMTDDVAAMNLQPL